MLQTLCTWLQRSCTRLVMSNNALASVCFVVSDVQNICSYCYATFPFNTFSFSQSYA